MARQSNSDKLAKFRRNIDYSKRWREQENYNQLWQRMINLYRGRQYRGYSAGDRLLVNITFSTINTLAPAVSIGRPKINVNPRNPWDANKAILTESIINYWWQHYGCQPEFQRAVKDYLIIGHGWVKTGYRFVEEAKVDEVEYSADEAAEDKPADDVESTFIIREDRPFLERVDPFDMFVDPDGTNMNDIRWIAQRTRRPLLDAKSDMRYDAAARKELSPSSYRKYGDSDTSHVMSNPSPEEAYCDIYEYYNIDTGELSVFSDSGGDKFLIKPTKMPYAFGHPFFMLRNYEVPGFFYPMGELEAIEPLQYELNETRTQMMLHRKRYSRKWLFQESAFDDDGRQALASDEDNVIVPVKGGENLQNVVVPMPALINPPEFYNQSALIQGDIDRVSGVSEYQRGAIPETTRTAREAMIIAEAGNARVAEKLIQIENGIAACASNLIMLAQQFLTGEQTVRIVGTEAAPVWLTFDRDYISGEFDFTVEAGSTTPRNEAFRRDMALQMVSAMQPFAQAGLVNLPKLAEYVLQQGFGVKDPSSFLKPPAPEQPPVQPPLPPELMAGPGAPVPPGMEGMPPEMMAMMGGAMPSGMATGMEAGMPPVGAGDLGSLPPELLQALMAQSEMGGAVPGLATQPMINAPITGPAPQIPEAVSGSLASLPPEIIQALLAQQQ